VVRPAGTVVATDVFADFPLAGHEHLYERIQENVLVSSNFTKGVVQTEQLLAGRRVVLCTMSMLSNARIRSTGITQIVPIEVLIVDEASQIEVGDYLAPVHMFAKTLKRVIFVGDDKQCELPEFFEAPESVIDSHYSARTVAPYGQDDITAMESIFELPAHRIGAILLDTSCKELFIPT